MRGAVDAVMNYVAKTGVRPVYHANDHSRDILTIDARPVTIADGREAPPSLAREGFQILAHRSTVRDFTHVPENGELHRGEIHELIRTITGADEVQVNGSGVLRFAEKSALSGKLNNSRPARFAHVDVSDATAAEFAAKATPEGRRLARYAMFNVWRAITLPPQDVPLAFCDWTSVAAEDLIASDAVFDVDGEAVWSFEGLTVAANPAHRWTYFSDMTRDEVVIFTTNDSDRARPHCVPHCAFDDARVADEAPPRASLEMRATALWYA